MICARSRHLKCTARDKASAISIKIVACDWLKSQNLTKNLLFSLFFWAKFGGNAVAFAFAEFCCHGIWGAGSNRARDFSHISRHFGLRCTRGSFLSVFIFNVFIIFGLLVLNTVEVSDQPFRVISKKSYPFYAKWFQRRKWLQRLRAVARITFECVTSDDVQLVNWHVRKNNKKL